MTRKVRSIEKYGIEKLIDVQLINAYSHIEDVLEVKEMVDYLKKDDKYEKLEEARDIIFELSHRIDSELDKRGLGCLTEFF